MGLLTLQLSRKRINLVSLLRKYNKYRYNLKYKIFNQFRISKFKDHLEAVEEEAERSQKHVP